VSEPLPDPAASKRERWSIDLREASRIAWAALRANKARGALTTLGIVIGIVAVVLTMAAANGLQNKFRESFAAVGTDILYVSRTPWIVMNDFFQYRNRPGISLQDAEALEHRFTGRAIVNTMLTSQKDVKYRDNTMEGVTVIGTTERQTSMSSAVPSLGRFLLPFEVTYKRDVCVLGSEVAKRLFGSANPLNKVIHIQRAEYRVIGVMEKQGGGFMGGPNLDLQIFVPITSYVKSFANRRDQDVTIAVRAPQTEALADVEYAVTGEMRKIRHLQPKTPDNFSINKLDTLLGTFNNMMGVVLLIGLVITSISLFVGAIGVMNIMFVTVTERTREIGIRKAIGATRRSILLQFLCESCAIGVLGGSIGLALATALTFLLSITVMPAKISWPIVAIAVGVSAGVGVIAGIAPAFRGARLDPIEALRYE
jgi:putative ABC transport system permease protein